MEENNDKAEIYSQRVRAGKRTYFFDVKSTRSNDFYVTITESKRKFKDETFSYEKHKILLYKEDFVKFMEALQVTIEHVKSEQVLSNANTTPRGKVRVNAKQARSEHKPTTSKSKNSSRRSM